MTAILKVKDGNGNVIPIQAIKGEKGDKGDKGDRGLPGTGGVPDGGTTGQVLAKNSNADGDAGWSTPEPFVINSGEHYNQLFVNKSYAEIKEAYESGKNVVIIWNNKQYPLSSISDEKVEFVVEESITNSDDYTMYNIHTRTLAIYSESGKRATKDYINLNVYSINGCDKLFAPKASAVLTTEQTLTTEQQSQALANIGGLSKNQGAANSGKFLGIGADGIVVPTEVDGGGGSDRLIAKYVHSGNPVIQPTALDLTTGVFTCAGHGLTTGDTVMVIPDGSFSTIPFELCSTSTISTAKLTVGVIDTNTFTLRNGSTDITYPNTNNTTVDVSKWHIEKSAVQIYTISGFSAKEIKVILSGFAWGSSNYFLNINAKDTSGYVKSRYANNIGATCKNHCMLPPFYNVEVYFGNSTKMNAMSLNSPTTEADYKYIQQYPQFMGYGSRSKVESVLYMYALADHDDLIELKLNSSNYDADNNLMLANGFTVEVYRLG